MVHIIRHYEDHPSVRNIKKNVTAPPTPPPPKKKNSSCSLLTISEQEQEVKKIVQELRTEKSNGVDKIPPTLIKLAAIYLARPLLQSINNSIKKSDCFLKMQRLPKLLP